MAVYCVDCEAKLPVGHRDVVGAGGVIVREDVYGPVGVMLTHPAMVVEPCDGSEVCENGRPVLQKGYYCCAPHAALRTGAVIPHGRLSETEQLDAEADRVAEERAKLQRERAAARVAAERDKLARERAEFEQEKSDAERALDTERQRLADDRARLDGEERARAAGVGEMEMPTAQDPEALTRRERKAAEREAADRAARERGGAPPSQ